MPVWSTVVQREKEEELVFRGRQYARAIALYQRKYAASYPASLDVLVEQKFLRKKFKDPMTKDGEFEIIYQGTLAQRQAALAGRGATSPCPQAMLREARIEVVDDKARPGCYKAVAYLRPHFQLEELNGSLRRVADLPQPAQK